jgi:hypothetical protein
MQANWLPEGEQVNAIIPLASIEAALEAEDEVFTYLGFYCPCDACAAAERRHEIWIPLTGALAWQVTNGEDIYSLSLTPSINAMGHGHWNVREGDLRDLNQLPD